MQRGLTGHYVPIPSAGESCRALVPNALPPEPPLVINAALQALLDRATLAVGRLDGLTLALPDRDLFLYTYVRKEAVLSSQIEGTQSSLSDLLLFENDAAPGVPLDDVEEVSSYVAAMKHGLRELQRTPLSLRLLRDIHRVLLAKGRAAARSRANFAAARTGSTARVPATPPSCRHRRTI